MDKARKWKISLYAMVALYAGSGINHFLHPEFYLSVIPAWLPFPQWANWISGVAEIILGVMLIPQPTRRFAAWMIILMLSVFFFLIHIPMCFHSYGKDDGMFWISVIRIPLQLVLINWAWKFAKKRKLPAL
jgi:uncharacterized membrane protein